MTSQPRKTSQVPPAGAKSLSGKDVPSTSQPRNQNQQASVSLPAKTARRFHAWEEDLRLRFAERTVPGYLAHARALLEWMHERGIELAEVRTGDLHAYQSELLALRKSDGRPYSAGHQGNRLKALKSFFRFLYRRGELLTDPAARLEYPRVEKRLPRVLLTVEEARRIVEAPGGGAPQGLRDRAILETLYSTGIRVTELANLTPFDVDTEERVLRVVLGKGRKDRVVPLTRSATAAVERYLMEARPQLAVSGSRWLFLGEHGGYLQRGVLSRIVRRWAKAARIDKHVTCHTFRHSVATHLLKGHADIRHIQALLGHGSLGTTERYTRVEISDLKDVIRRAHPRGR